MKKVAIERLMALHVLYEQRLVLTAEQLEEYRRLWAEFQAWDPQRLDRWAEEHKKRVEEAWKQAPPPRDVLPADVAAGCTCGKPLWMVPPYPPCPVHGPVCGRVNC